MLKVGLPNKPQLPAEPPPEELPLEEPTQDLPITPSPKYDAEKVDPQISGYMGPESGPFMCGRCTFFDGANSCAIVSGPIDANGVCNLFTPQDANPEAEAIPEAPSELPEEAPIAPPENI